jgi:hypothetical protein
MSQATQLSDSLIKRVDLSQLVGNVSTDGYMEEVCNVMGVVYVTSITRDGCSGCMEQKPLYRELAGKMDAKHPGLLSFANIHVRYSDQDVSQSAAAKKLLRHAAYPTYTIQVRSRFGPLEVYRAIYPSMQELEKQIVESMELAVHYKADAEKSAN